MKITPDQISSFFKYLIEKVFLTWQFITLLGITFLAPTVISRLNSVKVGKFQFTFSELAKKDGVNDLSINQLRGLTYDELKVFLIKCGEDGDSYDYDLKSYSKEKFLTIHRDLDSLGFIKIKSIDTNYQGKGGLHIDSHATPKAIKLHRAILDAIYQNFTEARLSQK